MSFYSILYTIRFVIPLNYVEYDFKLWMYIVQVCILHVCVLVFVCARIVRVQMFRHLCRKLIAYVFRTYEHRYPE